MHHTRVGPGCRLRAVPARTSDDRERPLTQTLATGARVRCTGPQEGAPVLCLNGGAARPLPGTWGASIGWIVRRLAGERPDLRFVELRYRTRSWRDLEPCVEDANAAVDWMLARTAHAPRVIGYSMGGAVGTILMCMRPELRQLVGLAPWIPDRLDLSPLRGRRIDAFHGSLDAWLPGIPGVSPANSRRGVERARQAGADAHHTMITAAVHAVAFNGPGSLLIPAPRAGRWAALTGEALGVDLPTPVQRERAS